MRPVTGAPADGSWEVPGRNPLAAAIAGLLICGALYSTAGGLVLSVIAGIASLRDQSWLATDTFAGFLMGYYRRFQVPILLVTAVMELAIFLGLTFLLVRRWHASRPARYLGYRRPAALDLALAAAGAIVVVPIAQLLDSWSTVAFPVLRELRGGEGSLLAIRTPGQGLLVVVAVALVPAVCEEALFRGWLQGTIRRAAPAAVTVLVTGILFALFHMSPLSIVALAFVGFYLGWLFDRCGTIFASMTAHCFYNLTIIVLVNADPQWPWLVTGAGDFAAPAVAGSLAVFAAVVAGIELCKRRTGQGSAGPGPLPAPHPGEQA